MNDAMLDALLAARNDDGGWGMYPGRDSSVEATALAALGTGARDPDHEAVARALDWLRARQQEDGSWFIADGVPRGSWTTSLAVLALGTFTGFTRQVENGFFWLARTKGNTPGIGDRIRAFFTGQSITRDLDPFLVGWPWEPGTFSWVEPTCYALIAFKKFRGPLPDFLVAGRIEEAEHVLLDRVCPDGGWNHGNGRSGGQDLRPYPDTTALALLALQDRAEWDEAHRGVASLERLLEHTHSGLALSLAILALPLHGRDVSSLRTRLEQRFAETGFLRETRPLALALIATGEAVQPFRVTANV